MGRSSADCAATPDFDAHEFARKHRPGVCPDAGVELGSAPLELPAQGRELCELVPRLLTDGARGLASNRLQPRFEGGNVVRKRLAFRRDRRYREP
jgi:hypothetical protein